MSNNEVIKEQPRFKLTKIASSILFLSLASSGAYAQQEEASVEFTAPKKPGKYLYICTYIAHGATMRGYMIVE